MNSVKIAYIASHTVGAIALLGGGATLTFLGGTAWWFWGALIITSLDGWTFGKRMNLWTGSIS